MTLPEAGIVGRIECGHTDSDFGILVPAGGFVWESYRKRLGRRVRTADPAQVECGASKSLLNIRCSSIH